MQKRLTSISLVFPAFNEELNIEAAVETARRVLRKYSDVYEIIVVNDGSADRTGEIINRLAREDSAVVALHHVRNLGYGATLGLGLKKARHDFVFFSDSDLQFNLEEIGLLIEWIDSYPIVIGYRANRADPWHRRLNAWGWNRVVRLLLGVRVRDIDCAFKLFHRKVLDQMHITAAGAMVNTEILAQAARRHLKIKELPVSHFPRLKGTQTGANLRVIIRAFAELFRMRNRLKNGEYATPIQLGATEYPR